MGAARGCPGASLEHALERAAGSRDSITPLIVAVDSGHAAVVSLLLEAGADVNKSVRGQSLARHTARGVACACMGCT